MFFCFCFLALPSETLPVFPFWKSRSEPPNPHLWNPVLNTPPPPPMPSEFQSEDPPPSEFQGATCGMSMDIFRNHTIKVALHMQVVPMFLFCCCCLFFSGGGGEGLTEGSAALSHTVQFFLAEALQQLKLINYKTWHCAICIISCNLT